LEEAATVVVAEQLDGEPREPVRLLEEAQLAARDVQLVQAVRDVRVVVEEAAPGGRARAPAAAQAPVLVAQRAEQEVGQTAGRLEEVAALEAAAGLRQRGEREAVPRRDHLVVAPGLRTALADLEQPHARLLVELAADDRAAVLERLQEVG